MRKQLLFLITAIAMSVSAHAQQKDTVHVQGYYESGGQYGTLNAAINAAIANNTISNTVFKLTPYEVYVLTSSIALDHGQNLEIVAPPPGDDQESAPPQIVWTEEEIDRQHIIQSYGDVTLKHIWVRYADFLGNQVGSAITFENQREENKPERGYFEGVIFDYAGASQEAGGSVTVKATHFEGIFKDSYFRNNTDFHLRYYGRALSFPYEQTGWGNEYVLFENTTFANIGYVYMQEASNYGRNVHFNHCTFLNVVMFGLQSGWWYRMSVTNSVFVNPFMFGTREAVEGLPETAAGGIVAGFTLVDSLGFDVDFTDHEREVLIARNSYVYEDWLIDWMENSPYSQNRRQNRLDDEIPQPVLYLNEPTLAIFDSVDAGGNRVFPKLNAVDNFIGVNPGFIEPATNVDDLKAFLNCKWDTNCQQNWAYAPEAGFEQVWPLPENMAFSNSELISASLGEFPIGDLNWFPEHKAAWEAQREEEWDRIESWMATGTDPTVVSIDRGESQVPTDFVLQQNYPNPFNPTTQIRYSVPNAAHLSIKVYNTLGQEVATLFEGMRQAGNHEITFDASGLGSGMYFYRLQTADGSVFITRKLLLMK